MKSSLAIFFGHIATSVAAFTLACAPAGAASYAAGTLAAGQQYSFDSGVLGIGTGASLPGVAFSDSVTFTLATSLGLTSQLDYTNIAGDSLIGNFSTTLFRVGIAAPLFQGIDGAQGDLITNRFVAASLAPGDYTLIVSGAGSGALGGAYFGAIGAVPAGGVSLGAVGAVPELPGWAGMLLGLAFMGTLLHRRGISPTRAAMRT